MRNTEKSRVSVLLINTLELIAGMIGLVTGHPLAAACCLFLLSLNSLLIKPSFIVVEKELPSFDTEDTIGGSGCTDEEGTDFFADTDNITDIDAPPDLPPGLLPSDMEYTERQVELFSFLNELLQEFNSALSSIAAHTIIHTPEDSIPVSAPPPLLRLAFLNIMDNTLKYLPRSGTITITLSIVDTQVLLIWKDNGNGVADNEVPNLFNLNFQGSNRLSGTGLGLSQTQAAIEAIGGSIYVKSSIGKGFALYLQLPLTECHRKGHRHE